VGREDPPEDARGRGADEEPEVEASEQEPDLLAVFDDDEEEPEVEASEREPAEPEATTQEASIGARPPRHRALRVLAILGGALAIGILLVGWNRVAASDDLCASCHEMEPAVASAQRSVHDGVPCLACHTGPGLMGALRYLPSLAREAVDEFTGWDVAHGVLEPRDCGSCHDDIASTPELAAAHREGAKCLSCHGDVAHPPYRLAGFERPVEVDDGDVHPRLYVQTHGDDVVGDPESCVECHETNFCETCHLRETFPHPDGWIQTHGSTQEELGIDTCEGCHPQTFCIGCHGTEIPHNVRWLGEHWRDLADAGTASCLLCHPRTDCTDCHAEHSVHREQDLYA
jgi:predicted CXXCH cytochrome family protein